MHNARVTLFMIFVVQINIIITVKNNNLKTIDLIGKKSIL